MDALSVERQPGIRWRVAESEGPDYRDFRRPHRENERVCGVGRKFAHGTGRRAPPIAPECDDFKVNRIAQA
jgi:hypothetical protein